MSKSASSILCVLAPLALAACGSGDGQGAGNEGASTPKPLSQLDVNSAKRQCVSVAVLQQVPREAATGICACTVDRLIKQEQMTGDRSPSDAEQQAALDACIAQFDRGDAATGK